MDAQNHKALITVNLKSIKELPTVVDDFELWAQLKTNKKVEITDWTRERFVLAPQTTQNIEFGESVTVNFMYLEVQGSVMLDLMDESQTGFGEGGFGEGGFGGVGSPLSGFHVNGIFCAEGDYSSLVLTNTDPSISVVVDL